MSSLRRALALGLLVIFTDHLSAQGIVFSNGSRKGSDPLDFRGSDSLLKSPLYGSRGSRSLFLSIGGGYGSGYGWSPYPSSFGRSRVTVVYTSPQVVTFPLALLPQSNALPDDDARDSGLRHIPERRRNPADDPQPAAAVPPVLPGQNAGAFRPIAPDERERARRPVEPDEPDMLPVPQPAPQPPAPALPPNANLVDRGRAAFAAGEYGRAADHFRRAAAADPADPLPAFLLVETLIALEKYTAAAATARSAVERFADWPVLQIRPLDLYGANAADYSAHVIRLEETRAAHADDAVLQFLSGHVLWFDGRKDEARPLFRRAAASFPAAERFLRLTPPAVQ